MRKLHLVSTVLIGVLLASQIISAQQLTVENAGKKVVLSRADIEMLPRVRVTATGHSADTKFEGVTVWSVLEKAGVSFAESMKGKRLASCLLVEAADGYRVVIALPELDPDFTDKQILLVFLRDGSPLREREGPYRIVIPEEKRMARWVRQVTALRIMDVQ
jgi:hypothetical protein